MRWDFVWRVTMKELLSTVRDRRTIVSSVVLPLVMIPVFLIGLPLLVGRTLGGEQEKRQVVGVVNLEAAPAALVKALQSDSPSAKGVDLVPVEDGLKAVQDKRVEAAIRIPDNVPTEAGGAPVPIQIFVKQSSQKSLVVLSKIQQAVEEYGRSLVAAKLRAAGLPERTLTPVVPTPVNADTAAERASGVLAFIIPLFILQWIVVGGQATAIDATAGEKERGTLEALLVTPIRRIEVVAGKLIAVVCFSVLATVFSMLGLVLTGVAARTILPSALSGVNATGGNGGNIAQAFGGNLAIGLGGFVMLLVVGLTVAVFLAAVLLAVCIFARSFKEAQTYIAPIALVIVLPAVSLQFADFFARSTSLYATPIIGSMLVILDVVKGVVNWSNAGTAVLVNAVCALIALRLALRSFNREQVLFRN